MERESEEKESKLKTFVHAHISLLFHFVSIINWVLWTWVNENRVVIFLYSPLLISGFFLLSSPVDVGHINRITLNTCVMSSLSLLAYSFF